MKSKLLKKLHVFFIASYLLFNFFISYVPINRYFLISFMILAFLSSLGLSTESSILSLKEKVAAFFLAFFIEFIIILVSAFIFESGHVLQKREDTNLYKFCL